MFMEYIYYIIHNWFYHISLNNSDSDSALKKAHDIL